jgi:hypothetical protein
LSDVASLADEACRRQILSIYADLVLRFANTGVVATIALDICEK